MRGWIINTLILIAATVAGVTGCDREEIREYRAPKEPSGARQSPESPSAVEGAGDWRKPDHWRIDPNPSPMLLAAFDIERPEGKARLTVSALPGEGGGLLANINRWRGQLGLPAVGSLDEQPTETIGEPGGPWAVVIDLSSADTERPGGRRMLAAVLPVENKTVFFKMTGPDAVVEDERRAFEQFVHFNTTSKASP